MNKKLKVNIQGDIDNLHNITTTEEAEDVLQHHYNALFEAEKDLTADEYDEIVDLYNALLDLLKEKFKDDLEEAEEYD